MLPADDLRPVPDESGGLPSPWGQAFPRAVTLGPGGPLVPAGTLRVLLKPGKKLLVPGSGAGREALHLARAGYLVTGFDIVPEMVEASIRNARSAGLGAEFLNADMADLDLHDRTFDGAYITPLVSSFVPGRTRRIECLRRLGRHLTPGGAVIFSAHLVHRLSHLLRLLAVTMRRRLRRERDSEFGDWFTWFLTPDGRIEKAFSHRFFKWQIHAEAKVAGFQSCEFVGQDHFVARGFQA